MSNKTLLIMSIVVLIGCGASEQAEPVKGNPELIAEYIKSNPEMENKNYMLMISHLSMFKIYLRDIFNRDEPSFLLATEEIAEKFSKEMIEEGHAKYEALESIFHFFEFLRQKNYIERNPFSNVRVKMALVESDEIEENYSSSK